jgi:putative oxidoreductase
VRIAAPELPDAAVRWLTRHSITVLRVCVGLVFLVFGLLKFQPGASPAEALARNTVNALTLHLINGHAAVLLTAEMETFIGLTLVTGWALRAGLAVMSVAMIGILSPLVLFAHQLFAHGVSLEAQYVFKDIVLVASGMVVAA